MIELFWSYTSFYLAGNFVGILFSVIIGYVFIRCKKIGYIYSVVLILACVFVIEIFRISHDDYAVFPHFTQMKQIVAIGVGTLAGGWRYIANAIDGNHSLPFSIPTLSIGDKIEQFNLYRDRQRFRKTYAEELAKEEARKHSQGNTASTSSSSSSRKNSKQSHSSSSQRKSHKKKTSSSRSDSRKDRFKNTRDNTTPPPVNETDLDILGLQSGATKAEIKSAYRSFANRFHPDKMPDSIRGDADLEAAYNAKFDKITKAYGRLK